QKVPVQLVQPQEGRLAKLLQSNKTDDAVLEELFLATLCRFPTAAEKEHFARHRSVVKRRLQAVRAEMPSQKGKQKASKPTKEPPKVANHTTKGKQNPEQANKAVKAKAEKGKNEVKSKAQIPNKKVKQKVAPPNPKGKQKNKSLFAGLNERQVLFVDVMWALIN